ncbi:hypothetical protein C1876_02415 [Eggerthella sinensis]|jgi:Tfp pilus assembly protein PilV|uniref:Uncharacterized protein n=2 Tax=Eggerthella sinensis TaxID=242230 RepID=A0A3N0J1Z9_9ACTN|nr:hypothetical protein [Eggerthella sinensis]MCB7036662.1 hypothetical protein [Eggerthella sinensis]RDB71108.1 hypothetical protein C1876_02415 [Eggerthella sinensis]RNM43273.1 hypothetical protein DMP09_01025 [Eggerthella sinensis]
MMRRAFDKFRRKIVDQRGDSMVEALTAILIAVLGATMLATMVMASVSVAARSERALSASYAEETALMTSSANSNSITVTMPNGADKPGSDTQEIKVMYYTSNNYTYYCEGQSK